MKMRLRIDLERKPNLKTWIGIGLLTVWWVGAAAAQGAPTTPKLEDLPLKDSVSQYGITWTFEKPARTGQFINGDWYVVGPVTVVKIDPAPRYGKEVADDELDGREKVAIDRRCRNGSMLNSPARQEVAWDSGILNYYHPEHRARLPIAMKPGDSLASSISLRKGEKVTYPYHPGTVRGEDDNSPVKIVAVLTCVAEPLPPDAFRPGYCGHDPRIYLARDLKRELLPHFDRPAGTPDPAQFAENFQRPWCDAGFFSFDVPQQSMPNYAQAYAQCLANAVLLACCDGTRPEDRERLIINVIQIGIDHYGLVRNGHPGWAAHGGHGSGRKFPIVFAGAMLGDEDHGQHQPELSPRPPSARMSRPPTAIAGRGPRWCSPATPASMSSPASAATSSAPAIPGALTSTCRPHNGSPSNSAATPTAGPTPPPASSPKPSSCGP